MSTYLKRAAITCVPFILLLTAWELIARYAGINPKLTPTLFEVATSFVHLIENGILVASTASTLVRLLAGYAIAIVIGVTVGLLIGSSKVMEDILLGPIMFFYPIPGIAYAPLFVLWFGLGDLPAILLVAAASSFPVIINTWKGVHSVKPIWLLSGRLLGAREWSRFIKITLPGAMPYVLVGLRLGIATAWRILVAVEMLTSVQSGLGWLIFGSKAFLQTDVMLSSILVIGVIGFSIETFIFKAIEGKTVVRWGMLAK